MSSCVKTSTTLTTPQVPAEENQPQSITLPPWLWCPGDVQCCRNYGYKVQHGPTCFLITWCTLLQNVFRVGWFMSCHYSPFSTRPLLARNSCSSPNAAVGLSAASRPVFPSVLEGYPGLGCAIYMSPMIVCHGIPTHPSLDWYIFHYLFYKTFVSTLLCTLKSPLKIRGIIKSGASKSSSTETDISWAFRSFVLCWNSKCSSNFNLSSGVTVHSRVSIQAFSLRITSFNNCFLMLLWKKRTGHCVENIRPFLIIDSHIRNTGKLYICNLS